MQQKHTACSTFASLHTDAIRQRQWGEREAFRNITPTVTDPVKRDPVDTYPSSSENLATPVPGEIFRACGVPCATFTYPAYIICVCLKKAKQRPDIKGRPVWWKICWPGGVFPKLKPGENTATSFPGSLFFPSLEREKEERPWKRGCLQPLTCRALSSVSLSLWPATKGKQGNGQLRIS